VNKLEIFKKNLKLNKSYFLLEVGCNVGLVTLTLSKLKRLFIEAIDENNCHLEKAKKNLFRNKNVKFKKIDFFKLENKKKYDIILFREFFNIFSYKKNLKTIKKSENILKDGGMIILIDFYTSVITRSNLIRFFKNKEKKSQKFVNSKIDFEKYFNKKKWDLKIINKDLLDQHVSFKGKILEMIYPVKYTLFAKKKK